MTTLTKLIVTFALGVAVLNASTAQAVDAVASGDWNSSSIWTPAAVPGAGDNVNIDNNNSQGTPPWNVTVTTNQAAQSVLVGSSSTLGISAGTLTISNDLTMGNNFQSGHVTLSGIGALSVGGTVSVRDGSLFTLGGGNVNAGTVYVGAGALNLNSGTLSVTNDFFAGNNSATGNTTLTGAAVLSVGGSLNVRDGSTVTLASSPTTVGRDIYIGGASPNASKLIMGIGLLQQTGTYTTYVGNNSQAGLLDRTASGSLDLYNLEVRDGSQLLLKNGDIIRNNIFVQNATSAQVTFSGHVTQGTASTGEARFGYFGPSSVTRHAGSTVDFANLNLADGTQFAGLGGDRVRNSIYMPYGDGGLNITRSGSTTTGFTLDGSSNSAISFDSAGDRIRLFFTDPLPNFSGLYWALRWLEDGSDVVNGHVDELTTFLTNGNLIIDTTALTGSYDPVTFLRPGDGYTYVGFEVTVSNIPEPASLSLLVFSGLAMLRRRRS